MSKCEQQDKRPQRSPQIICPDEAHIWWTRLDPPAVDIASVSAFLSEDEKRRAKRFVDPRHGAYFIAAHATLRMLLGHCLGIPPESVPFVRDANGKPYLAAPYDHRLRFNLSHSAGMALFGVCSNRHIGVDIECIRPMKDMKSIARRFFTKDEYDRIANTRQSLQEQMFFALWSMKEACLKATGRGLSGLESLKIDILEEDQGRILEAEYIDDSEKIWSIRSIKTVAGYAAAVAVEGNKKWILKCRYHGLGPEA